MKVRPLRVTFTEPRAGVTFFRVLFKLLGGTAMRRDTAEAAQERRQKERHREPRRHEVQAAERELQQRYFDLDTVASGFFLADNLQRNLKGVNWLLGPVSGADGEKLQ